MIKGDKDRRGGEKGEREIGLPVSIRSARMNKESYFYYSWGQCVAQNMLTSDFAKHLAGKWM